MTLFRTAGALVLAVGATGLIAVAAYGQHDHASHTSAADPSATTTMARCPTDGMKMHASGMVKVEHERADLHFCTQDQADAFLADPGRTYRTSRRGDMTFHMSFLPTEEYTGMMKAMGMGRMVAAEKLEGQTHHVNVWVTDGVGEPAMDGAGLALRVVGPDGAGSTTALHYNTMLKTYEAALAVTGDGEQKVAVVITAAPVTL